MQQMHPYVTSVSQYEPDKSEGSDEEGYGDGMDTNVTFTSSLSGAEKNALKSWIGYGTDIDKENKPLPDSVKADKNGKPLRPLSSLDVLHGKHGNVTGVASSVDGAVVAACTRNGTLLVLNSQPLELLDTVTLGQAGNRPACTAICFRPQVSSASTSNVALVAQGEHVLHVHCTTGQVLQSLKEEGDSINALAVRSDGQVFASGGSDMAVRVYDEASGKKLVVLDAGNQHDTAGHSNTIFSVVWQPEDPQVLLSAGWDKTVQVWDLRAGHSVRSIFGPYVCGDALDVAAGQVLTGSWRNEDALQLWDYGSGQLMTNLVWDQPERDACLIYAAKFAGGGDRVVAGGSGRQPMCRVYRQGRVQSSFVPASAVHSLAPAPAPSSPSCMLLACAEHVYTVDAR